VVEGCQGGKKPGAWTSEKLCPTTRPPKMRRPLLPGPVLRRPLRLSSGGRCGRAAFARNLLRRADAACFVFVCKAGGITPGTTRPRVEGRLAARRQELEILNIPNILAINKGPQNVQNPENSEHSERPGKPKLFRMFSLLTFCANAPCFIQKDRGCFDKGR